MREIRQAGNDPAFLLKALGEASGEFRRTFDGLRRRDLLRKGAGFDDCWCLLSIAVHMRDTEGGLARQLELMTSRREPEIPHVDLDSVPLDSDWHGADAEDVLDDFAYHRRRSSYLLWDLLPSDWERAGVHPFRGRLTVLDVARDMYQHDLEHLWQARRILDAFAGAPS